MVASSAVDDDDDHRPVEKRDEIDVTPGTVMTWNASAGLEERDNTIIAIITTNSAIVNDDRWGTLDIFSRTF